MQAAVADWQIDRSPDKTANLLLQFPEMKEAITSSQGILDEATKKQDVDFAVNTYGLLKGGMNDRAIALMEQRIAALKNTRGREQDAQSAEALLEMVRKDPNIAINTAALYLGAVAPDVYKNVAGSSEKIAEQKEYEYRVAKDGKAAADAWWQGQTVKAGLIPVQGVGLFRASDFAGDVPAAGAKPQIPQGAIDLLKKNPSLKAQFDAKYGPGASDRVLTPAPAIGANGMPATLTRSQYQATVNSMGKAATDAWMQRNNITLSGQ